MEQVRVLQPILHEIHAEGMQLYESFQIPALTEKLPPLCEGVQKLPQAQALQNGP